MSAPAASARRATLALAVSTETSTSLSRLIPSITGRMRRSSSSSPTSWAPGRLLSPPMSMMSAPSVAILRPALTAASASGKRPPSEKESGVTLSTPITRLPAELQRAASAKRIVTRFVPSMAPPSDRRACTARPPELGGLLARTGQDARGFSLASAAEFLLLGWAAPRSCTEGTRSGTARPGPSAAISSAVEDSRSSNSSAIRFKAARAPLDDPRAVL